MNKRFVELDILRGLSVIGMILVITPGSWEQQFNWLKHAEWEGFHLSDMIFPTFLFCVGFAIPISLSRRLAKGEGTPQLLKHIIKRGALLILIGLFLNGFPTFDLPNLRLPGVLQRISLCWVISSCFYLYSEKLSKGKVRNQLMLIAFSSATILFVYWAMLFFVPVPGFENSGFGSVASWPAYLDRQLFGISHLWRFALTDGLVTYDPEGILSTFPACVNVLIGVLLGIIQNKNPRILEAKRLFAFGFMLGITGYILGFTGVDPIIKKIWTSSFALLSVGFAVMLLALVMMTQQGSFFDKIHHPAKMFGSNALLAYIIASLLTPLMDMPLFQSEQGIIAFRQMGLEFFLTFIPIPEVASLTFSIVFLTLLYGLLWKCYTKKWFLKL